MFDTASTARDNTLKQTLQVMRDAIEFYRVQNGGAFPGQATNLPEDLTPYLKGRFPTCPVGQQNSLVSYTTGSRIKPDAAPTTSWKYSTDFGIFICNSADRTSVDPTSMYFEF